MIMRAFLRYIFLLLLFCQNVYAQKLTFSPYSSFDIRNGIFSVVGKLGNTLYTFRSYGADYFLDMYNEDMSHTTTVVLDFFPRGVRKVRFVCYENKIFVLYQEQSGTRIVQYAALLSDKGILQGRALKIDEHRSSFFGSNSDDFYFSAISENKEHVLVYRIHNRNKQLQWQGYWIDPMQVRVVKRQKIRYKFPAALQESGEVLLNNQGQAFLTCSPAGTGRNQSNELVLLNTDVTQTNFRRHTLELGERYIENQFLKLDEQNGTIYFAALYAPRRNGHNEGIVTAQFNWAEGRFSELYTTSFGENLMREANPKRKNKALDEFRINQIIPKQGGGMLIAAEEVYVSTQSNYMPGIGFYSFYYNPVMAQTIREYHFNDIFLLDLDAEHRIQWHRFIHKDQYSQEDAGLFSSYILLNTGGGLGFLFNDFNSRRSRIQLTAVSPSGEVQNGFLDAGLDDDPDWLPKMGKQVDTREVVVPCLRKKQVCFAKITL